MEDTRHLNITRLRQLVASLMAMRMPIATTGLGSHKGRYADFLRSEVKTKGRRDRSLKQRSNRRKAQARAR